MLRYFFHLHDHVDETDHDGMELADEVTARIEAILFVTFLLGDKPTMVEQDYPVQVNVTDEGGNAVCTMTVRVDGTTWSSVRRWTPPRTTPMLAGMHERLHVITGGPGSGKTTLIDALAATGLATSPEVGRALIREQVASGGDALPWGEERAFADLMLPREIAARDAALAMAVPVVLDRGVPDVAGFLRASGLPVPPAIDQAARLCRYNPRVFLAPFWGKIYTHDAERIQPAALAKATQAVMVATYRDYGYTLIELPRAPVPDRVAFVLDRL